MTEPVQLTTILQAEFARLVMIATAKGGKTSEGDGKTAADIEADKEIDDRAAER